MERTAFRWLLGAGMRWRTVGQRSASPMSASRHAGVGQVGERTAPVNSSCLVTTLAAASM